MVAFNHFNPPRKAHVVIAAATAAAAAVYSISHSVFRRIYDHFKMNEYLVSICHSFTHITQCTLIHAHLGTQYYSILYKMQGSKLKKSKTA